MLSKPQLLIYSGLQASGKSTKAREWVAKDPEHRFRVNWDELRLQLFGPDWKWNHSDEQKMKAESWDITKTYLEGGYSVVIDNTNLTTSVRNYWKNLGLYCGAEVIEEELDVPVAECVRRDRLRQGKDRVGRAVIERAALFTGWIDFSDENVYHKAKSGRDFCLVDLDGTLADCSHRLHHVRPAETKCDNSIPEQHSYVAGKDGVKCWICGNPKPKKNWPAFFAGVSDDSLIEPIAKLVKILSEHYYIIIVSGRPVDPCGIPTEDWLLKHGIDPLHLFMRGNDKRSDVDVKGEIADLLPLDRVAYVIDDRPAVITGCWRKRGLTTLSVGDLKDF